MFGRKNKDFIDEMSDGRVDDMDVDVIDDTREKNAPDYFDSSRYYDPSRYEKEYEAAHDSHLCEEGHDHSETDRRRNESFDYKAKNRTPDTGGHLCEDGEEHESIDRRRTDEVIRPTDTADNGQDDPFTSFTDYSPGGKKSSGSSKSSGGGVFIDPNTYTRSDTGSSGSTGVKPAVYIVLAIVSLIGICTGMIPMTIIAVVAMIRLARTAKNGDYDSNARDPDLVRIVILIVVLFVVVGIVAAFLLGDLTQISNE